MDKNALAADLVALAAVKPSDRTTSKAARLRAVLPEVEMALQAGRTQAEVLAKLNEHGLDMTLAVFTKTLNRLRGSKARTPKAGAGVVAVQPAARRQLPPVPELHDPSEPVDMDNLINAGKQGRDKK